MITFSNYNSEKSNIDWSQLPKNVQEAKDGVEDIMEFYDDDSDIKETVDLFLKAINKVSVSIDTQKTVAKKDKTPKPRPSTKKYNYDGLKVSIRETPTDYAKGNFFIWDIKTSQIFANEYFKTKAQAKRFVDENKMVLVEESKEKSQKSTKTISTKLDKKSVDNFSKEFMLVRRFYNMVNKGKVTFRSVQLTYQAFQKAIVSRDVRKTSSDADLFAKTNEKVVALYKIADKEKVDVKIEFSDKKLLEQMKNFATGKKVDYAITLLKSFIGMQGTKPDAKKASNLLGRINKAIDKKTIDIDNRLYNDILQAKNDLIEYSLKKVVIEPEVYGLSKPQARICDNRVKCEGITSKGTLKKGYKYAKGGAVVKITPEKKKTVIKKLPKAVNYKKTKDLKSVRRSKSKVKQLGTLFIEPSVQQPAAVVNNEGLATAGQLDNVPTYIPPTPQTPKQVEQKAEVSKKIKGVLSSNDIMNMKFDTLHFDGEWDAFMQDPAKNMKIAIWGKPKNGKTAGATKLANYLTKFGNVLYNFADQGVNKSTKDLWIMSGLSEQPNAHLTETRELSELDRLCATGDYDFVFIDMINTFIHRTGIKYFEFEEQFLKKYPKISFILIFEVTKSGDFKGDQGWTHLPDALVTVENFVMENTGRYGVGHYIVWKEGLQKTNPKKYKEYFEDEIAQPQQPQTLYV